MILDPFHALTPLDLGGGASPPPRYYALSALERAGMGRVSRLPVSLRIVLESLLRHCDGQRVTEAHVRELAAWQPRAARTAEIPFIVARILLQDLSGLPALNDLASMRATAQRLGRDPSRIEPCVPVDLVVDHAVSVDVHGRPDALVRNIALEYARNGERLRLLKWGQQAFSQLRVVPPGNGIVHQINLEYLARGVCERGGIVYPDTLVATDSHATMIGGIGVLGWGVGGIEAMAGMLGEPICFLTPDVVGVHLHGTLRPGVTATDLVLTLTERLRRAQVVGKFVEYFGAGATSLSATDRATVANMAPDYGATCGYFAVDDKTLAYFRTTGRSPQQVQLMERYYRAQGLFGIPVAGDCDYSEVIDVDLADIVPTVSGPSHPEQRIALPGLKARFEDLLRAPRSEGGYARAADTDGGASAGETASLRHGDVLIAAITSCTNTSNPRLMLGAGLLAQKAVAAGLRVNPKVKTSLAPGSKVVTAYLREAGLLSFLEQLGFHVVAHGCTTCMGNSGPLDAAIEESLARDDLIACAVLSGNRNFEARIHDALKANFLMSPALVVAFALAGTVRIDLERDPIGHTPGGTPVYLRDLWPSEAEIDALAPVADAPAVYAREYGDLNVARELWDAIEAPTGAVYDWDAASTYILEPPFFDDFSPVPGRVDDIRGARALALFGDGLTTDHISPNAGIKASSPAGHWLQEHGASTMDSYAMRRCNHHVMVRGTFGNTRIVNRLVGAEGGLTRMAPNGMTLPIFDAAMRWRDAGVPLVVFGGEQYGTGSSRDWAARGPQLLGVSAVIASSFERIHRSNLVGMGIVPCELPVGLTAPALGLDGSEQFDLTGLRGELVPRQMLELTVHYSDGRLRSVPVRLRADTPIELDYLRHGGIMPFVLRAQLAEMSDSTAI